MRLILPALLLTLLPLSAHALTAAEPLKRGLPLPRKRSNVMMVLGIQKPASK